MNIPQLRIQSTNTKIDISTRRGQLKIEQPLGELEIEQPSADMNITRNPGKLTIDQTQARADIDLKSVKKRMEEAAQLGKQGLLEGIARRIQEGEELMGIEHGFQAISSIAKRNSEGSKKEFGLGYVPKAGSVQTTYEPGNVEIKITPNKPKINYTLKKPNVSFEQGEVNVNLKQHASLMINFES